MCFVLLFFPCAHACVCGRVVSFFRVRRRHGCFIALLSLVVPLAPVLAVRARFATCADSLSTQTRACARTNTDKPSRDTRAHTPTPFCWQENRAIHARDVTSNGRQTDKQTEKNTPFSLTPACLLARLLACLLSSLSSPADGVCQMKSGKAMGRQEASDTTNELSLIHI